VRSEAAAPFDLVDGEATVGVLLVHGFTGTPFEVRYLGDQLSRAGFGVKGLLLPGHATRIEDLDATRWQDWAACVEVAAAAMLTRYRRVAVVGQSLGGLLALHAGARNPELACVGSLAAPLWLEGLSGRVAKLVRADRMPLRAIPKLGGSDVRDKQARAANPCYPSVPMRALGQLLDFMEVVDGELREVTQPVLVLHARHDHTAPVACASRIVDGLVAAGSVRIRILPRSYHLIAVDVERDIVAAEVAHFVRGCTQPLAGLGRRDQDQEETKTCAT